MKILKIRFENINSLKGTHEINFMVKPLSEAGLFAITGPTGSGKTTILDVISLALFNRIPRVSERISKAFIEKTGLLLTRNMPDCFAEVTYESGKGIFTSKWSISSTRNGTLRDYEMEVADVSNNILPLKKADVPAANEENIGLNFEQFVRAIILAQGDFSAFLRSKGDERGRLLEQVTGSWIYRELGKSAFQKNKQFGQELESLLEQERLLKDRLLNEESFKALIENLAECELNIKNIGSEIKILEQHKKLKTEIGKTGLIIKELESKEEVTRRELDNFLNNNNIRLERHRTLMPFQKRLWDWRQLQNQIKDRKKKLETIKNGLISCDVEDKTIKAEVLKLTGTDKEISEALTSFEEKVLSLEKQKTGIDIQKRNQVTEILKVSKELQLRIDTNNPSGAGNFINSAIEDHNVHLKDAESKLDPGFPEAPEQCLQKLQNFYDTAISLKTENFILKQKIRELKDNQDATSVLEKSVSELPGKADAAILLQRNANLLLINYTKDRQIRDLSAKLDDHRARLREGEACPLCGSTEHPYKVTGPVFADDLDIKIKQAEEDNERCKKVVATLETELSIKKEELQKKKEAVPALQKEVERIAERCKSLSGTLPEKFESVDPDEIILSLKNSINRAKNYMDELAKTEKLNSLGLRIASLIDFKMQSEKLEEQRKALFSGDDVLAVTRAYRNRYTVNHTKTRNLKEEKEELSEKLVTDTECFETLQESLNSELSNYNSPDEALKDLLDNSEYTMLDKMENSFKTNLVKIETELKVNRITLKELKEKESPKSSEEIDSELEILKVKLNEENLRRDGFISKKSLHEETLKDIARMQSEIEGQRKKSEKWVLLNKYIGDAEGKRFSTFAQQLTLSQLVKLANHHLKMLNERYLLDIPGVEEDDSLTVIDTDMGDLRRSVKSLSGGESFLVSLSLALALSDLASRQVEIKSLFIDEGFGSLDKLILDQTIDTLEKLQYETSKTIGVISHTEAMQERISTQIKVSKNGQGYSKIDII